MRRRLGLTLILCLWLVSSALGHPYNTPTVDGHVTTEPGDWMPDEWVADDSPDDCRWGPSDADLDDLYVTWDETSLYVGITTVNGPAGYGNAYLLYIDADSQNGITGATDFTSADFYARRIGFSTMGADAIMGFWNMEAGSMGVRHCGEPSNTTPVEGWSGEANPGWKHIEISIPWEGLYGIGPGQVPPGTVLRLVAAISGGDQASAYDAMPNSSTGAESDPSTPWDEFTDLDRFVEVTVDANGDGVPDNEASPVSQRTWGVLKELFAE
jgi:hypothetical protein